MKRNNKFQVANVEARYDCWCNQLIVISVERLIVNYWRLIDVSVILEWEMCLSGAGCPSEVVIYLHTPVFDTGVRRIWYVAWDFRKPVVDLFAHLPSFMSIMPHDYT